MIAMSTVAGVVTGLFGLAALVAFLAFTRWDAQRVRRRLNRRYAGIRQPVDLPPNVEWAVRRTESDLERQMGLPSPLEIRMDRRLAVSRQSEAARRVAEHRGDRTYLEDGPRGA